MPHQAGVGNVPKKIQPLARVLASRVGMNEARGMAGEMRTVEVTGDPLTIEEVVDVAFGRARPLMADSVPARMAPARAFVDEVVSEARVVYGVTTGFGALSSTTIKGTDALDLQYGLVRSHAAGVGDPLPHSHVRAMLLLRARTLAQGHSGIRPEFVARYLEMIDRNIIPVVPAQGSVGASGDLAPFAHLALTAIGEGEVFDNGERVATAVALERHGLAALQLEAKEGLSLLNGTEGMLAFGCLLHDRAVKLSKAADVAVALSVEALMGSSRPFEARVHELRPHPGQLAAARNMARLVDGSEIGSSHHDDFSHKVQDAYSLRCAPQVHGACRDVVSYAEGVFERELGAVVDNPIIFADTSEAVSAGNFHGQPLAFAMDAMTMAMTEISSISERRTDRILDPERSGGLPAFLAPNPGVNSGYMITQYTAAALVAENRVLSHPASVESIPTSGSQEDHVSMGWGSGRKLWDVMENATRVVAVEILCATQGIHYRQPLAPAAPTAAAVAAIREHVPPLTEDRPVGHEIEAVAEMIRDGSLVAAVESVIGELE